VKLQAGPIPGHIGKTFGKMMSRFRGDRTGDGLAIAYDLLEEIFGEEELDKIDSVLEGIDDAWQVELLNKALAAHGMAPEA
jgi:hypothetical protein